MPGSILFLLLTTIMLLLLAVIAIRTLRRKNSKRLEAPKYRMMDDN